eukprot:TRINITY_DN11195_c0_g1_i2.p1 TRINITY_DN11195_c0_g1~~TRINITY_DN11195_c0_g1_i2.p1  ORF type:complete len:705 (+),score=103.20 TRINITY_DN11195_c0_g1_i2:77-2191(+)
MIRRPPRSTLSSSSAASDVYKRQVLSLVPNTKGKQANGCPNPQTIESLCSSCIEFNQKLHATAGLACTTVATLVSILPQVVWFFVGARLVCNEVEGRDAFKSSRDLLLSAITTAIIAAIIGRLGGYQSSTTTSVFPGQDDEGVDAVSSTLPVAIYESLWIFAAMWCALFVTSPFPSSKWFRKSRLHALALALIHLVIQNTCVIGASALSQSIAAFGLFLLLAVVLLRCWRRSQYLLRPPSLRVFLESFKRVVCNVILQKDFFVIELRCEDRSLPGALTIMLTFLFTCTLLFTSVTKFLRSLLPNNDSSPDINFVNNNSCSSIEGYSQGLVDAYKFMSCFTSIYQSWFPFLFAPTLYIDLMIHQRHWQGSTQFALVDMFADLPWHKFRFRADEWDTTKLLAAGSEGEIHLAELNLDREGIEGRQIVVKIPHVEGLEGLDDVLQEAKVLMKIQDRLARDDPGLPHIVALLGFTVDLPTVAILMEYCGDGDLLHKLADLRKAHCESPALAVPVDAARFESCVARVQLVGASRPSVVVELPTMPAMELPTMGEDAVIDLNPLPATIKDRLSRRETCSVITCTATGSLRQRVTWALQVCVYFSFELFLQVAKGLRSLHGIGVAHLDVKTDNVLLNNDVAEITDFGCAVMTVFTRKSDQRSHEHLIAAHSGTPAFMVRVLCQLAYGVGGSGASVGGHGAGCSDRLRRVRS